MKLYYMPGACSIGIHVLLEEIGKPYDLQKIDGAKQEQYGSDYVKLNPKSKVPTLQRDAGTGRTEAPAIAPWPATKNRDQGPPRRRRALDELLVGGIETTIPLFQQLVRATDIIDGEDSIHWLERWLAKKAAA